MRVTCLERVYSPSLRRSLPSFPLPSLRQRGPGRARASGGAPGCVRGGARSSAMYKGTNGKNTLAHERLMCGETAPPLRSLLKVPPACARRQVPTQGHPRGAGRGAAAPAHRRQRDPRVTQGSGTHGTRCSGGGRQSHAPAPLGEGRGGQRLPWPCVGSSTDALKVGQGKMSTKGGGRATSRAPGPAPDPMGPAGPSSASNTTCLPLGSCKFPR